MWTARSLHHSALRGGHGGHCCRALSRSQCECESGSPWPRRPKWAPTTVPFLGGTAHEGKSALNIALTSRSHLPFSLSPSAISLAVRCRPRWFLLPSAAIPILRFAVTLHSPRAGHTPLPPLPIPFHSPPSRGDRSKTRGRGLPTNSGGEWLGSGAHEEEDTAPIIGLNSRLIELIRAFRRELV
jgi:hypothetical protein